MQSFRILDGQARYLVAAVTLLIATLVTAFMPVITSAAQVTERSVALSSSAAARTGVEYTIKFTAVSAATSVVLDFCSESPLIGDDCTKPAGFDVDSGAITGFTKDAASDDKTYIGTAGTISTGVNTLVLTGVTNPSANGTFYVRILTYTSGAPAYTSTSPGTHVDDGAVAVAINNTIGVSAAVLESLTFCVSGADTITDGCASGITAPTLRLGVDQGNGVVALDDQTLSTGNVYTQISTNASRGAVVNLKSNATDCGGLLRGGTQDPEDRCNIAPALAADFEAGDGKFGLRTTTVAGGTGTFQPSTFYATNTEYRMNYISGNATGVTSPYGDPFLNTDNQPATNKKMTVTFGATAAPGTPAGLYSADINLVATGTF